MANKSNKQWLKQHFTDPYVKEAQRKGFRARAAFKLIEIHQTYQIFKSGMSVIDLGAAPGSWCQYASRCLGDKGNVLAVDILPMDPIENVTFIQGDFADDSILDQILQNTANRKLDCVLSDMAPNMSGIRAVDQAKIMLLVELALEFACQNLAQRGSFVCKLFHGEGFDQFVKNCRQYFQKVVVFKPKASRSISREVYCVAKNFNL